MEGVTGSSPVVPTKKIRPKKEKGGAGSSPVMPAGKSLKR